MNKILTITVLLSAIFFVSCNNSEKKTQEETIVTLEDINKLESEVFDGSITSPDQKKTLELGKLYVQYADANPNDSIAPDLLYKAADISMNIGNPKLTIAIFEKIINSYPNYKNIPTVTFLLGYVYENQLHDYDKAKQCYAELLNKYPDSDFADDATISIKNLGKSPEEMIKEFENNN
jgi:outer membrane protein assembly factor BamD (BamD/ComL family)